MLHSSLVRNVLEVARPRQDCRRSVARTRKLVRLMLESLEERLTPSGGNPTVTQTAGDYTALTAAVAGDTAANTNYVIQITNNFTFDSGGQVSISNLGAGSTLTIEGQNGTNYTLTGNGNRLFTIASGQNVTFADLTLTGGTVTNSNGSAQGGAIEDLGGNVTLSRMIVQGNTVKGQAAAGGGVYVSGASTVAIRDSILSDNSAQGARGAEGTASGMNGSVGGYAYGGGLYVGGSGWTATLTGDMLSGNTAIGGNGGNGAAGSNATAPNSSGGNGGGGGFGGNASGGAACFLSYGSERLTILNDLNAPLSDPSTWRNNSAQAGAGGNGGAGGNSTGTALDSAGGQGGLGGMAVGGALYVSSARDAPVRIGNSAFFGNKAVGGNNGAEGQPGTGGRFNPPPPVSIPQPGGYALGGGLSLTDDNVTMVNSTVAANTVVGGVGPSSRPGNVWGGGIYSESRPPANDPPSPSSPYPAPIFVNNTITQNTTNGPSIDPVHGLFNLGSGIFVANIYTTLVNNLIQGNQGIGASAADLDSGGATLNNAHNNFIGTMSANAVSTATNIVGNPQVQLGSVVGVDSNGNPIGGPIYYPVLSGAVSLGAGTTSVVNTIAAVEGTTPANAADAIGNLRITNGAINLGAVQIAPPPASQSSSPPPAPPALNVPPLLAFFDILFGGAETVNANGTETITDSLFGIPLLVSTFDSSGDLMSVALFGFNITFLFV